MSAVGFNPSHPMLQQLQLVSTLNSVAQNIASGNIEGALQGLVSIYSNMASDPVASAMGGGATGGIRPDFGNFARPAMPFPAPRPPKNLLPGWVQGGGLQIPQQLLDKIRNGIGQLISPQSPEGQVGGLDMDAVSQALDSVDLENLMEGREVTSGDHKGWSYGKINNEQELKDIIYNGIYEAQADDGQLTDDELLAVIDEAIARATTEGVVEELTPKEQEAFKAALIEALDPLTADNAVQTPEQQAGAAANSLAGAGLDLSNPAVQNFALQLLRKLAAAQQAGGYGGGAGGAGVQPGGAGLQTGVPAPGTAYTPGFNPGTAPIGVPTAPTTGGTGAATGAGASTGATTTAEEAWQNALSSYQQGTAANQSKYDQLLAMGVDPGQVAMMQMQEEMQRQNQLVSMLTNLMKMQHDTMKAVIQNLRV